MSRARVILFALRASLSGRRSLPLSSLLLVWALFDPQIAWGQQSWVQASTAVSPPARAFGAMVYDPLHHQVVLFGGAFSVSAHLYANDTWVWDGTTWTQKNPATSPPVRELHAMAYDMLHQEVVMFGGYDINSYRSDTWVWDGTNWTQKNPSTVPPAQGFHSLVYDEARQQVLLAAGNNGSGMIPNDTWVWDGSNWTQKTPATNPTGSFGNSEMAYDEARHLVVRFLFYYNSSAKKYVPETWTWDGTNWTQATPANSPSARNVSAPLMFIPSSQQTLLFVGSDANANVDLADTWVWDGANWTQLTLAKSPSPRIWYGMAYDTENQQVVLFGGEASDNVTNLADTWLYTAPLPELSVVKTHQGSFAPGQQNAVYQLTVWNTAGARSTNGLVTVTDTVPAGLTLISMAGNGWMCPGTAADNCTRSDVLPGGANYAPIDVTVNVSANAASPLVNMASVMGGAAATANGCDATVVSGVILQSPHVRDFVCNGRSDAMLYDASTGTGYTALSDGHGGYQYVYNLFTPAFDTLRSGDFNGDGKADLVLYNSHTSLAYIGMSNGDGTFRFQSLFWSPGYDVVESGDINGDGRTDFALYNSTTGTLYTGVSNGDGTFAYAYHLVNVGLTFVRLADFTGDGKADLFLYRKSDGLAFLGVGDGAGGFTFHPLFISGGYDLDNIGDLNGDGKADVLLYNSVNGNAATGIRDGAGGLTFTPLLFTPGFTSVVLADFTGDGKADVTVYDNHNALAYFGTGNGDGTFTFQSLFWSAGYDTVVAQDLNGDGKFDIVLYNIATGTEYSGLSNGSGFSYTYSLWGSGKALAR